MTLETAATKPSKAATAAQDRMEKGTHKGNNKRKLKFLEQFRRQNNLGERP